MVVEGNRDDNCDAGMGVLAVDLQVCVCTQLSGLKHFKAQSEREPLRGSGEGAVA